jgi:hypothetical protein
LLKARPLLFVAKAGHRLSHRAFKLVGVADDRMPSYIKKLDATISTKELAPGDGELAGRTD